MKELNILEIEEVSGAFFYEIGHAIGSGVKAIGDAIGGAYQQAVYEATNEAFRQQYG